ncbi:uncharacterized protein [Ptychodera flava]|uniref:uncharacterized protein n=1 Tax=Ptychodera flava TaxID=63121 RepID=UPI00396A8BA2
MQPDMLHQHDENVQQYESTTTWSTESASAFISDVTKPRENLSINVEKQSCILEEDTKQDESLKSALEQSQEEEGNKDNIQEQATTGQPPDPDYRNINYNSDETLEMQQNQPEQEMCFIEQNIQKYAALPEESVWEVEIDTITHKSIEEGAVLSEQPPDEVTSINKIQLEDSHSEQAQQNEGLSDEHIQKVKTVLKEPLHTQESVINAHKTEQLYEVPSSEHLQEVSAVMGTVQVVEELPSEDESHIAQTLQDVIHPDSTVAKLYYSGPEQPKENMNHHDQSTTQHEALLKDSIQPMKSNINTPRQPEEDGADQPANKSCLMDMEIQNDVAVPTVVNETPPQGIYILDQNSQQDQKILEEIGPAFEVQQEEQDQCETEVRDEQPQQYDVGSIHIHEIPRHTSIDIQREELEDDKFPDKEDSDTEHPVPMSREYTEHIKDMTEVISLDTTPAKVEMPTNKQDINLTSTLVAQASKADSQTDEIDVEDAKADDTVCDQPSFTIESDDSKVSSKSNTFEVEKSDTGEQIDKVETAENKGNQQQDEEESYGSEVNSRPQTANTDDNKVDYSFHTIEIEGTKVEESANILETEESTVHGQEDTGTLKNFETGDSLDVPNVESIKAAAYNEDTEGNKENNKPYTMEVAENKESDGPDTVQIEGSKTDGRLGVMQTEDSTLDNIPGAPEMKDFIDYQQEGDRPYTMEIEDHEKDEKLTALETVQSEIDDKSDAINVEDGRVNDSIDTVSITARVDILEVADSEADGKQDTSEIAERKVDDECDTIKIQDRKINENTDISEVDNSEDKSQSKMPKIKDSRENDKAFEIDDSRKDGQHSKVEVNDPQSDGMPESKSQEDGEMDLMEIEYSKVDLQSVEENADENKESDRLDTCEDTKNSHDTRKVEHSVVDDRPESMQVRDSKAGDKPVDIWVEDRKTLDRPNVLKDEDSTAQEERGISETYESTAEEKKIIGKL